MKTIWKYTIPVQDDFSIRMPSGAEILFVAEQGGHGCIWARVAPDHLLEERKFKLRGAGHPIDGDCQHLGSFMLHGGQVVFHLFEQAPERHS